MEVWQEIKKNTERGAQRLVSEYGNRLYAAALLLCTNDQDAEDLTFRTLERAIAKISQFDEKRSFFTWLYAILLNFRRMDLRRRKTDEIPMGSAGDLPETGMAGFSRMLSETPADMLAQAVQALAAPLREVVVMRYYNDQTLEEMAHALRVPPGTVKSRLHHARSALARTLSMKGGCRDKR